MCNSTTLAFSEYVIHSDYVEAGPAFVILCSCVWAQLAGGATCGNVVIASIGSRVETPLVYDLATRVSRVDEYLVLNGRMISEEFENVIMTT